jgi:hypothetical protein
MNLIFQRYNIVHSISISLWLTNLFIKLFFSITVQRHRHLLLLSFTLFCVFILHMRTERRTSSNATLFYMRQYLFNFSFLFVGFSQCSYSAKYFILLLLNEHLFCLLSNAFFPYCEKVIRLKYFHFILSQLFIFFFYWQLVML